MGRVRTTLLIAAGFIAPLCDALAWGTDGHRITGHIALALLDSDVRGTVRELLGHDDLARIATELDDDRDGYEERHRGAARWHYENRSVCTGAIDCPRDVCLTRQLQRFLTTLKDERRPRTERAEALIIVVHLLGDLHQPLHLADNSDRGGNDTFVRLPRDRDPRRLHEVWDTQLVRRAMQRRGARTYAQALLETERAKFAEWSRGSIEAWARETEHLGAQMYKSLPAFVCRSRRAAPLPAIALPESYVQSSERVVAEQLTKAGVRIAAVLNRALTGMRAD